MQFKDTLERVGRRYRAGTIYGLVAVLFGDPCGKIAELKAEATLHDSIASSKPASPIILRALRRAPSKGLGGLVDPSSL